MPRTNPNRRVDNTVSDITEAANSKLSLMDRLASDYYNANKLKNRYSKKESAARKDLMSTMKEKGISNKTVKVLDEETGEIKTKDVEIKATEQTVIDVAKLQTLVDEETFMKIVSATKTSVQNHAGNLVAEECAERVLGSENVSFNK